MKKCLLMLSLLFFILSCKKGSDSKTEDKEEPFKGCLVETATTVNGDALSYTYDSKGRVTKKSYTFGGGSGFISYEYLENKVKVHSEELSGYPGAIKQIGDGYYELDDKGRIVKGTKADGTVDEIYTYDSNGYLTSVEEVPGSFVNYTYANGNLVQIEHNYFTYGQELLTSDRFDIAKTDGGITFGMGLGDYGYLGKKSKNIIKTRTQVNSSGTTSSTYSFTKDAKGNITRMIKTTGTVPNTYAETTNYTYKCF